MKRFLNIVLLIWLLFQSSSQILKSADTVDVILKSEYTTDLCGNSDNRRVLVTINMGPILRSDSLAAFDFEAVYDTNKIRFLSGIYVNTLADYFDEKSVTFDNGRIFGLAYNHKFNAYVYGNRPLIGFYGVFKGNCPDTSLVVLKSIDFTDEFKKTIDSFIPAVVEAKIIDKPDRKLDLAIDKDTLLFEDNNIIPANISIRKPSDTTLHTLDIILKLNDTVNFGIRSINEISDRLKINSIDQSDSGMHIRTEIIDNNISDIDVLQILVEARTNENKLGSVITAMPVKVNDCSCLIHLAGDSVNLVKLEDTTGLKESDTARIYGFYNEFENEIIIESIERDITILEIYDLLGNMVERRETERGIRTIRIKTGNISKGIYLARIKDEFGKDYKLTLIIN